MSFFKPSDTNFVKKFLRLKVPNFTANFRGTPEQLQSIQTTDGHSSNEQLQATLK